MNKKEIAQQYTRQILGQEQAGQSETDNQETQQQQKINDYETQIKNLLLETYKMSLDTKQDYRKESGRAAYQTAELVDRLNSKVANTAQSMMQILHSGEQLLAQTRQVGTRWIMRVYLIAVLSAICSALITMLFMWTWLR